jgi:hypothetical protein
MVPWTSPLGLSRAKNSPPALKPVSPQVKDRPERPCHNKNNSTARLFFSSGSHRHIPHPTHTRHHQQNCARRTELRTTSHAGNTQRTPASVSTCASMTQVGRRRYITMALGAGPVQHKGA